MPEKKEAFFSNFDIHLLFLIFRKKLLRSISYNFTIKD